MEVGLTSTSIFYTEPASIPKPIVQFLDLVIQRVEGILSEAFLGEDMELYQ